MMARSVFEGRTWDPANSRHEGMPRSPRERLGLTSWLMGNLLGRNRRSMLGSRGPMFVNRGCISTGRWLLSKTDRGIDLPIEGRPRLTRAGLGKGGSLVYRRLVRLLQRVSQNASV